VEINSTYRTANCPPRPFNRWGLTSSILAWRTRTAQEAAGVLLVQVYIEMTNSFKYVSSTCTIDVFGDVFPYLLTRLGIPIKFVIAVHGVRYGRIHSTWHTRVFSGNDIARNIKIYFLNKPCFAVGHNFYLYVKLYENYSIYIKDAMPVSFRSELFTSYILTISIQWNLLP